jgi:hypothetical protein
MSVAKLEDLQPWRTITVERIGQDGKTVREDYVVWYTSNAIFKLERAIDMGFEDFIQVFREQRTGFAMLQALLFAGLEGARLKMFTRKPEWTIDSTGDLIDACGGHRRFWLEGDTAKTLGSAIAASLPVPKQQPDKPKSTDDETTGPEGQAAEADPLNPATTASTGAASSTGHSTAASKKKGSGT